MTEQSIETIQERFAAALGELIVMCMDGGMHTSEMIKPMEKELAWMRARRDGLPDIEDAPQS